MKRGMMILLIFIGIIFIFFINLISAANLPTVGGDTDTWGDILNAYLLKEHNADGTHGMITVDDITVKGNSRGPWLDVRAYGAKGDGVTDDTNAIQAAINNASRLTGGIVFIPQGDYLVSRTLIISAGITLQGAGPGSTRIVAANNLSGDVIGTNLTLSPTIYAHWAAIKDLYVNARNQSSGEGIRLRRIAELTIIDRVEVVGACGNGITISESSTPMVLGYVSVMGNGRCGNGSGIFINNSQYTSNYIEYISGDNNKDALLRVKNLNYANLYLGGFKVEISNNSYQKYVIWFQDAFNGVLTIGSGRVTGMANGTAILYGTGNSKFNVLGGIYYDIRNTNYSWYYASDSSSSPNESFIELNGRPFSQASPYYAKGDSNYSLELEGALKALGAVYLKAGFGNGLIFTNSAGSDNWDLTTGETDNESIFFRFIKNGADERWISLFDSLYSPTGIDEILFSPTNVPVMTLLGNGRVGIGTSTPSSRLEVNGTVTLNTTTLAPLIFVQNTTPILCNSTNAGGIIYSSGKHYGCDGTNWNAFS
jgi:hypothetical protein